MIEEAVLGELRELEVSLHRPEVRRDPARVSELLHESFTEFGRSGKSYDRSETLEMLSMESAGASVWSRDFAVDLLTDGVALLTYKSARVAESGEATHHALRSSLWVHDGERWRLRFHQGTACEAFEP